MTHIDGFPGWEIVEVKEGPGYSWEAFGNREAAAKILYDDTRKVWEKNCSDGFVLDESAVPRYTSGVVNTLSITASSVILCPGEPACGSFMLGDLIRRATAVAGLPLSADEEHFCFRVYTLATRGRLKSLSNDLSFDDHDMFIALYERLSTCFDDILRKLEVRALEACETWC